MNKSFYYDNAENLDKIRQDLLYLDTVKDPLKNPFSVEAKQKQEESQEDIMTKGEREAYLISNYAKRGYVPTFEGHQAYMAYRKATDPNGWGLLWDATKHATSTVFGGVYDMVTSGDVLNPVTTAGTVVEGAGRGTRYFVNMLDTIKYDPSNPINRALFSQGSPEQQYADFQETLRFQRETDEIENNGYWVPKKEWDVEGWKIKSFNEKGVAGAEMILDPSILMPELKIGSMFARTAIGHAITSSAAKVAVKGANLAEKATLAIEGGAGVLAKKSMGLFEYPAQKVGELLGVETLTTSSGKIIAKDSIIRSSSMALGAGAYFAQVPFLSPVAGIWLGSKVTEIAAKTAAEALAHAKTPSYLTIADRLAYQSTDPAVRSLGGIAMRMNGLTDWATQGVKSTFHGSMYGGAFGFAMGGEEGFYSGVGTGIGLAGSFHMLGGAYGIVGNRTQRQIENAQKHFAYVAEGFDEAKRVGVNRLLENIEQVYGQEKMFRTMANIAATERLNKNGRNLILTSEQIRSMLGDSPEWAEYSKLMQDPQFGGFTTRRAENGEIVTIINADYAAHSAVTGELFHAALLQRYGQSMKENIVKNLLGTADTNGFLYKLEPETRIKVLEDFKRAYLDLDSTAGEGAQRSMLKSFDDAIERVRRGEKPETLYPIFEEFAEAYFNRWVEDKPIDYLLKGNSPLESVFDGAKKLVRSMMFGDTEQLGGRIQFKSGEPEGFFLDGSGKRVVIAEMDKAMRMLVREMKRDKDALEGFPIRDNANPYHIMLKDAEHMFTRNEKGQMVLKSEAQVEREMTKSFSGLLAAHAKLKPEEKGLVFTEVKASATAPEGSFAPKSKKAKELEAEAKKVENEIKKRQRKLLREAEKQANLSRKEQKALATEREWDIDLDTMRKESEAYGPVEYTIKGYMTDAEVNLFSEFLPASVVKRMAAFNRTIHNKGSDGNNILRFTYKGDTQQGYSYTKEGSPTGVGNERVSGREKTRDIIPYEMNLKFERRKMTKALREEFEIDDPDVVYLVGKPVLVVHGMDMKALDRRVRYAYNHMRRHDSPRSISSATVKQYYESEEEIHHDIKRLLSNYSLGDIAMAGADFFGGGSEGRAKRDIINGIIGARPSRHSPEVMQEKGFHYPSDLQVPFKKNREGENIGGPLNEGFMVFSSFRVDRVLDQPKHLHGEGFYYNHKHAHPLNKGNFAPSSKALRDHTGRELSPSERVLQDETTFKSPSGEPYRLFASDKVDGVHYAWFDKDRANQNHSTLTEGYMRLRASEVLDLVDSDGIHSLKELDRTFLGKVASMGYKAVAVRTAEGERVVAFTDFQNFRQTDISAIDFITGNFSPKSTRIGDRTRARLGEQEQSSTIIPKGMSLGERTRARTGVPSEPPKTNQLSEEVMGMSRAVSMFGSFGQSMKGRGLSFFDDTKNTGANYLMFQKQVSLMTPEARKIAERTIEQMTVEYDRVVAENQKKMDESFGKSRTAEKAFSEKEKALAAQGLSREEIRKNPERLKLYNEFMALSEAYGKVTQTLPNPKDAVVEIFQEKLSAITAVTQNEIPVTAAADIVVQPQTKVLSPAQQKLVNRSASQKNQLIQESSWWAEVRKENETSRQQFIGHLLKTPEFKGWTEAELYRSMYNSVFGVDAPINITKGGKVSFGVLQSLSPIEYQAYRERGVLPRDIRQRTAADIDMALMENWKRRYALQQSIAKTKADIKATWEQKRKAEAKHNTELDAIRNELVQMLASYKMFDVADEVLGATPSTKTKQVNVLRTTSNPNDFEPARPISKQGTAKSFEISKDNSLRYEMMAGLAQYYLGRPDPIGAMDVFNVGELTNVRKQMTTTGLQDVIETFNKYNLETHAKFRKQQLDDLALYQKKLEKNDEDIKAAETHSKKKDTTEARTFSNELRSKILQLTKAIEGEDPIVNTWKKADLAEKKVHEILQMDYDARIAEIEAMRASEQDPELAQMTEIALERDGVTMPESFKKRVTEERQVTDPESRTTNADESGKYRDAMDEAYKVLQRSIKKDGIKTPLQRFTVLMQSLARTYKKHSNNPAIKQKLASLEKMFKETEQVTDVRLKAAYAKMLDYGFISMNWSGDSKKQVLDATGHYVKLEVPAQKTIDTVDQLKFPKGWQVKKERVVFTTFDGVKVSDRELARALADLRKRFGIEEDVATDADIIEYAKNNDYKGVKMREVERDGKDGKEFDLGLTGEIRTIKRWSEFTSFKDNKFEETDGRIIYIDKKPKYVIAKAIDGKEIKVIPFSEITFDKAKNTYYWSRDKGLNEDTKTQTYRNFNELVSGEIRGPINRITLKDIGELTLGKQQPRYAAYKANGWHIDGKYFKTIEEAKRLATIDAGDFHADEVLFKTAQRLGNDAYTAALAMIQSSTGIKYDEAVKEATGFKQTKKTFEDNPNYNPNLPSGKGFNQRKIPVTVNVTGSKAAAEFKKLAVYRAGNLLLVTSDNRRDVLTRLEPESKVPVKGGRMKNIETIARESQGEFNKGKKAIGDLYRIVTDENGQMAGVEWVTHYDTPKQVTDMLAKMNDADYIDIDTTLNFHARLTKQMKALMSANFVKEKKKIWEVLKRNPERIKKIKERIRELEAGAREELIKRGLKDATPRYLKNESKRLKDLIDETGKEVDKHLFYLTTEGLLKNKEAQDALVGEGKMFETKEDLDMYERDLWDSDMVNEGEYAKLSDTETAPPREVVSRAIEQVVAGHTEMTKNGEILDLIENGTTGSFRDEFDALEREMNWLERQLFAAKGGSDKVLEGLKGITTGGTLLTGRSGGGKVLSKEERRAYEREVARIDKKFPDKEDDVAIGTVEQLMAESLGLQGKEREVKKPRYLPLSEPILDKFGNPTELYAEKEPFVSTEEYMRRFRLLLSDLSETYKKFGDPTALDKLDLKTVLETDASLLPIKSADGPLSREEMIRSMGDNIRTAEEFLEHHTASPEAKDFKVAVDMWSQIEKDYMTALSENRIKHAVIAQLEGTDRVLEANKANKIVEEKYREARAYRLKQIDATHALLPEEMKTVYVKYIKEVQSSLEILRAAELERVNAEIATINETAGEFSFIDPNSKTSALLKRWQEEGMSGDPLKKFAPTSQEAAVFPSVFSEFHPSRADIATASSYTKWESRQTSERVQDSSSQGYRYGAIVGGVTTTNPIISEIIRGEMTRNKFLAMRGVREIDIFGAALARKSQVEGQIAKQGSGMPIAIDQEGYALLRAYFPDMASQLKFDIKAEFGHQEKLAKFGYAKRVRETKKIKELEVEGTFLDRAFDLYLKEISERPEVIEHAIGRISGKERLAELMLPENLREDGKIDFSKLKLEELDFAFHLLAKVNDPKDKRYIPVTELVENPLYRESIIQAFTRNEGKNLQSIFGDDWESAARFLAHNTQGKKTMVDDIIRKIQDDKATRQAEKKKVYEESITEEFKRKQLESTHKKLLEDTKKLFLELAQTDTAIKSFKKQVEGFWNSRPQARDNVLAIDDSLKLLSPNMEYGKAVVGSDGKTLDVPVANPNDALFRTPNGMFHAFKQGSSYKLFFAGYKSADGLVDLKASHIMTAPDLQRLQVGIRMFHDDIKRVELMARSQNQTRVLPAHELASFTGSFLETHANMLSPEIARTLETNLAEIGRYPDVTWLSNPDTGAKRQIVIYPNSQTWNRLHSSGEYIFSKGSWYKDPSVVAAKERLARARFEYEQQGVAPVTGQEAKPSEIVTGTADISRHDQPPKDERAKSIDNKTSFSVVEEGPIYNGKGMEPVMQDWTAVTNNEGFTIIREQNRYQRGWDTKFKVFFPSGVLAGVFENEEDAVARMFDE